MTRFLAHTDKATLLADLATAGFEFDNPEPFTQVSNGKDSAIWLGKIPKPVNEIDYIANTPIDAVEIDNGDNIVIPMMESKDYCANVTACEGITFATEIPAPSTPYNVFA